MFSRRCIVTWWTIILLVSLVVTLHAQQADSLVREKKWALRGYIKDMQSLTFNKDFSRLITGNLIHNRINLHWTPNQKLTGAIEVRNRLYWGEEVRLTPDFASTLRHSQDAIDLSAQWKINESMVWQTNIDRLWLEYQSGKWGARVGHQRINWGIGTIWNPNDIFNTYNFLDFDYEERPGRNAVNVHYNLSEMSNIQVAGAAANDFYNSVMAARYFVNRWNYDFQFTAGFYHEKFTAGAGWSGSIQDAGFKGAAQYFLPSQNISGQLNITLEADYLFEKSWYLNAGFLFNSKGFDAPVSNWELITFQFSPESLMPTKWNSALTIAKEFTPLFSGNVTVIYAPGTNLMLFLPSVKYNMANNFDVDFIWQSFFLEQNDQFEAASHRGFFRFRWSF